MTGVGIKADMWRVDPIGEGTFRLVVSEFKALEFNHEFNYDQRLGK